MDNIGPIKNLNAHQERVEQYALNINDLLVKLHNGEEFKFVEIFKGNIKNTIISDKDDNILLKMEENPFFMSIYETKSDVTFDCRFSPKNEKDSDVKRYTIIEQFGSDTEIIYWLENDVSSGESMDYIHRCECTFLDKNSRSNEISIEFQENEEETEYEPINDEEDIDDTKYESIGAEEQYECEENIDDNAVYEIEDIEDESYIICQYVNEEPVEISDKDAEKYLLFYTDSLFSQIHSDLENRITEYKNLKNAIKKYTLGVKNKAESSKEIREERE